VVSTKYVPISRHCASPKMVIFLNQMPDMSKLSKDRYVILEITKDMCKVWEPELDDELAPEPEELCQHGITQCVICSMFGK